MITRLMTLFFNLLFELYLLVHFVSAFEDLQDSCNPHFALSFGLWDTHLCPSIALLALSGLWGGGGGEGGGGVVVGCDQSRELGARARLAFRDLSGW